jgi:hypothetical protein
MMMGFNGVLTTIHLIDLQNFVNCRFRQNEFPASKICNCGPFNEPQGVYCLIFNQMGYQEVRLSLTVLTRQRLAGLGVILVHTPVRQTTRSPEEQLHAGGMVFFIQRGRLFFNPIAV